MTRVKQQSVSHMKTLEQILDGVTYGGKWSLGVMSPGHLVLLNLSDKTTWIPMSKNDADYAVRSAASFPELVRVLKRLIKARPETWEFMDAHDKACSALAEALK